MRETSAYHRIHHPLKLFFIEIAFWFSLDLMIFIFTFKVSERLFIRLAFFGQFALELIFLHSNPIDNLSNIYLVYPYVCICFAFI